jgi:hypothetical protein
LFKYARGSTFEESFEHAMRFLSGDATKGGASFRTDGTGHVLEGEWRSWVLDKGIAVKAADAHFLGFCKKRGPYKR